MGCAYISLISLSARVFMWARRDGTPCSNDARNCNNSFVPDNIYHLSIDQSTYLYLVHRYLSPTHYEIAVFETELLNRSISRMGTGSWLYRSLLTVQSINLDLWVSREMLVDMR